MTNEQIEKAAQKYAENYPLPPFFTPDTAGAVHAIAKSSYMQGAQDALTSQWISVEERLPKENEEVLTYTVVPKYPEDENAVAYYNGCEWFTTHGNRIRPNYWCPIPQFDPEKEER